MIQEDVSEVDIAYIAGFFDGEGCVTVGKNGAVDVRIVNTGYATLLKVQSVFGGNVAERSQIVNKKQYVYTLYGENAVQFLSTVEKYLIDKKNQALTVLEYFSLREEIPTIRTPGVRGSFSNPDRQLLVEVFREILAEQKKEST